MTTGEWISLSSSIGAMSAALIALFTLLELSRQRKSTYKPDLCVLKNRFNIKLGQVGKISSLPFAIDWVPQGLSQLETVTWATIRIVNVGFGVAKEVKAKWKFDSNTIIDEVNNLAQQTFQTFFLVEKDSFLSIMSEGKGVYSANSKMDYFQFEYLLPIANQPSGHDIFLPPSYVLLVSAYLSLCVKSKRPFSEIKVPVIELELSCVDIGKEKHNSKHKLEGNITVMTQPVDDESLAHFEVEYVEVA